MPDGKIKAAFIEPMLLLRTDKLPEGPDVVYELELDGYPALAMKTRGKVQLRSRNNNDFNGRHPHIVKALAAMSDETVIAENTEISCEMHMGIEQSTPWRQNP